MCCPHGQAFKDNLKCGNVEGGLNYDPKLWDNNDKVFLKNWEKENNFQLSKFASEFFEVISVYRSKEGLINQIVDELSNLINWEKTSLDMWRFQCVLQLR